MRVGILTTSYPRTDADVAGEFVRGQARTLASLGHDVEVLAPEPRELVTPLVDERIALRHVRYLRPRSLERTFYGAGAPDNLRRDLLAIAGAVAFPLALLAHARARASNWDAVISHWAVPSALVAGALGRAIPHVAVLHSGDVHLLEHLPARRELAARIEATASHLWFVSSDLAERFERVLGRPVRARTIAPMGFSPMEPSAPTREQARSALGVDGFVVFSMGRLVDIKGLDLLVGAMAGLGATLVVAGEGPERGRLEALARSRGVSARFVGVVRGASKAHWLRAADAFAHPSRTTARGRTEGAPVSLLEAMHAGLPVVATTDGGVAELVGDAGILVASGDQAAIRDGLSRIRHDAELARRLAENGRARASRSTWTASAARLDRLVRGAL